MPAEIAPMLAASSRVTVVSFGNFSRGSFNSSNLSLHPGKQRLSCPLCVSLWSDEFLERRSTAPILDPESELCASQTIGLHMHEVHPSWVSATPPVPCALRHFTSSLARWCWLAKRVACRVQDGTLFSSSRKKSTRTIAGSATTKGRAGQI